MADGKLSIGQVSKRTGIPVKTLRFWSDEGLVPASGRTRSGAAPVAAALRAALRTGEPSETELRRLWAVTHLSNEERKATIQRFYDQVGEGLPVDASWSRAMVDAIRELVATMKGSPATASKVAEWTWLVDAIKAAL
jgi:hypothetical protein